MLEYEDEKKYFNRKRGDTNGECRDIYCRNLDKRKNCSERRTGNILLWNGVIVIHMSKCKSHIIIGIYISTRKYEYDENWQLTRCTEKTVGGKTVVYNYTYDKVGNRTVYERIENGVSKEKYRYEYNEANQLVKRKNTKIWGDKGTTYTYDGDGNLIREKGNEYESSVLYEYTAENRLAVVKQGDAVLMAALYDGDNNRVFQIDNTYKWEDCYGEEVLIPESQRTEDGNSPQEQLAELFPKGADSKGYTLTEYINDINQENTEVLAEYTAGDTMRQAYIYGAESAISGEQIRQGVDKEGETGYYYLYDGRESVAGIQQNISLTNSYRYDPYGNLLSGTTDAINYYGYNAESANVKTGLQYLRARYYDAETGRFTSEDTETGKKENPLSRNMYLYVVNNPLNYADPRGRFFKELWNTAKKGFKKAANWVNNHIVQPVKRAFKKAANWASDKVSSVCNAVSDWWDGVTNPAPVAYAGYNPYTYGYSTYTGGTRGNASYVPIQQRAAYMSDAEIGQLSSGYGLSGEQLVRYQKQRSEVIRKQMEKKVCTADQEKAKADWKRVGEGALKIIGGLAFAGTVGAMVVGTGGIGGVIVIGTVAAFGAADVLEGGQDIAYGVTGSDEEAWNPIKDTIFQENDTYYYAVEGALGLGASLMNPANTANQIKPVQNLTERAKINKGVGNPVKIEGKGSTGRVIPNSLNEQMAMHEVQSNPLQGAKEVPVTMGDERWPASRGWVKMQREITTSDGRKITIHFNYNKVTGAFDDFKYK